MCNKTTFCYKEYGNVGHQSDGMESEEDEDAPLVPSSEEESSDEEETEVSDDEVPMQNEDSDVGKCVQIS